MKKIGYFSGYILFLGATYLFYIVPFKGIFLISNFLYFVLYHLIGYRKTVVIDNLKRSFPEKSEQEIKTISRAFFHHLADIIVETMKGFSLTPEKTIKRYKVVNMDVANELLQQHKSFILVMGHYNNWEWGTITGSKQLGIPLMALYNPLSNPYIDNFIKKQRMSFSTELISMYNTFNAFNQRKEKCYCYVMIADQNPFKVKHAIWVNFLNQETACIHGPERYAQHFNYPVIYAEIEKVSRGHYELSTKLITDNPNSLPHGEITKRYMKLLEESIRRNPQYWLWSHKRWKLTKPKNTELL